MKFLKPILALSAAGLLGVFAAPAHAGDVSVDLRFDSGRRYAPQPYPVYQPVVGTSVQRVWVPPVYQTVTENTWHEPVTQDQVSKQWIPDQYDYQAVNRVDPYGRVITVQQQVLIAPGHWQETHNPIVVQSGYWAPETKQVVVSPGYWQTVEQPVVIAAPPPVVCYPAPQPRDQVHVFYGDRDDRRYRH